MSACGNRPADLSDTCIRDAGHAGTHLGARGTAWWDHAGDGNPGLRAAGLRAPVALSELGDPLYSTDPLQERQVGVAQQGHTPYDVPYMSHVRGNLWQGGCDPALALPSNIEHVVSLYPWRQYTINHAVRSYTALWWEDADVPAAAQLHAAAAWVHACVQQGPTLVHCQAGLNRSSLLVAAALMYGGMAPYAAIMLLRRQRSQACLCNKGFMAYLLSPEAAELYA